MSFIQVSGLMLVSEHEAEMAKKDAEIERLKAEFDRVMFVSNGRAERLAKYDAEIERLKAFHKSEGQEWNRIEELLNSEVASLKSLITELAGRQ